MSARKWETLHPVTRHDIEQRPMAGYGYCACAVWDASLWWLCPYHVGFDEGAWAQEARSGVEQ